MLLSAYSGKLFAFVAENRVSEFNCANALITLIQPNFGQTKRVIQLKFARLKFIAIDLTAPKRCFDHAPWQLTTKANDNFQKGLIITQAICWFFFLFLLPFRFDIFSSANIYLLKVHESQLNTVDGFFSRSPWFLFALNFRHTIIWPSDGCRRSYPPTQSQMKRNWGQLEAIAELKM